MSSGLRAIVEKAAQSYPFPIAAACRRYVDAAKADSYHEWGLLSRDVLQATLHYLSHLLLSDLATTGRKPTHLYHRVQSVLSRPMGGHYVGFLRETAKYYRDEKLQCGIPELTEFLVKSDVDCTLTGDGKGLLGMLVDYRNLWAHGRLENPAAMKETVGKIRELTALLLESLAFLTNYPLQMEDGTSLMGGELKGVSRDAQPLVVLTAGGVNLRPLLLKLKGEDLALLDDLDIKGMKLVYHGSSGYHQFKKKELEKGEAAQVFEDLKRLLTKVRAMDAVLPQGDWESFKERSSVITDKTLSLYGEMRKYVPELYVPRKDWEGEESVYRKFLASDKTLLAINGVQGTGKSALVSRLAKQSEEEGHAVLMINAQRFTFAEVKWHSENPYPEYFAAQLHYQSKLDREGFRRIVKTAAPRKQVILVIDAINEVDGLEDKWNRFRAMELLLEWVSEIAQPGLKVVLSFRLDAYEEYGYLKEEDVPKNLYEISYPGNNPRKTWIHDLEPFNEELARALYEKLQLESRLGMAPSMSWDEVRAGLGDKLKAVTDNPLIFTVFLRAHHLQSRVLETDLDRIFERYAGKLTGALEAAKRPWWRKVIEFLKNGNITPKELFLADIIGKMSEEGSAAFLVERLKKGKKRDERMLKVVNDLRDQMFKDLKEGGLIVEEEIETEKSGQPMYSRRITFVGELMVVAMEGIFKKIGRRQSIKTKTILSIGIFILLTFDVVAGLINIFYYPKVKEVGHLAAMAILELMLSKFILVILYLYFIFISLTFSIDFRKTTDPGIKVVGLDCKGHNILQDYNFIKWISKTVLAVLPMLIAYLYILIIIMTYETKVTRISLLPLELLALMLLWMVCTVKGFVFLERVKISSGAFVPALYYKQQERVASHYRSAAIKKTIKENRKKVWLFLSISFACSLAIMPLFMWYNNAAETRFMHKIEKFPNIAFNTDVLHEVVPLKEVFIAGLGLMLLYALLGVPFFDGYSQKLIAKTADFLQRKRVTRLKRPVLAGALPANAVLLGGILLNLLLSYTQMDYLKEGMRQMKLRAPQKALKCYSKHIDKRPDDPKGYFARAMAQAFVFNNIDNAMADFDKAIELEKTPDTLAEYYFIRGQLKRNANPREALDDFDSALVYTSSIRRKSDLYEMKAHVYLKMEHHALLPTALLFADSAVKCMESDTSLSKYSMPHLLALRGSIYLKIGKREYLPAALADYTEAIRLEDEKEAPDMKKVGEWHYQRGLAYRRMNRKTDSDRDWRLAKELGWDKF